MSLMWMGVATVVAAACSSVAESRQVQVNLTTSFLASPLHPVLETSEYLSQDNPALFFTYVAAVDVRYNAIKDKNNVNYTKVALEAAADVLPADSSVSRLLPFVLQTRAHSPSIELFNQTCAASGQHDFQLPVDHEYPSSNTAAATAPHVIVYGALTSPSFRAFHSTFVPLAVTGKVHYIVRHAPTDNTLPVLVHGYGPWQLTQLGYLATQYIMAAEDPLKRLQLLSQNFPKYASSLVLASKPVPQQTIDDINHARSQVATQRLYNRIVVNGLPVDFNEYGFNAFDFLKSLNGELRLADTLAKLDPTGSIKAAMGSLSSAPSDVRISLRGPVDGDAPLYLNSIETDEETAEWPTDLGSLRGPSWSLIYLRKTIVEDKDVATVFHVSKMFLAARANGKSARDKYLREVLSLNDLTVKEVLQIYSQAVGERYTNDDWLQTAKAILTDGDNDGVWAMTNLVAEKNLPINSQVFNGVVRKHVNVQEDIMTHFARAQPLYQTLVRANQITDDSDMLSELLGNDETYAVFCPWFDPEYKPPTTVVQLDWNDPVRCC
ncbi:hypothetical protein DYB37_010688 [Aphanomyces astaci]|uniref:Uncharacterized protein n=1 Tax=Aphanomyces astaci TaxID=112090 RepID=A0A3R6Y8U3_APHAT|nr:hypothetical protein DYB37_010688 [Aphanomyces astaci]